MPKSNVPSAHFGYLQACDELLKDILGLANGNSHFIRKTKYLIIGADNENFDEKGMRVLHDVDYKIPEQSDLVKWLILHPLL